MEESSEVFNIKESRDWDRHDLIRARVSDMIARVLMESSEFDSKDFYAIWSEKTPEDIEAKIISAIRSYRHGGGQIEEGILIDPLLAYCPLGAHYEQMILPGFVLCPYFPCEWTEEDLEISEDEKEEIYFRRRNALMHFYTDEEREWMKEVVRNRKPLPQPLFSLDE